MAASLFWGGYEQAGSTLNLFADRYTRLDVFGFSFPSSWFQSVQPIFVIMLAPIFAWMWLRLGAREPSVAGEVRPRPALHEPVVHGADPGRRAWPAARASASARCGSSSSYFVSEIGELCVSPIGLSAVTKLAPLRIVGLMMGVWFLSNAFGNKLAGWAAGFFSSMPLNQLFAITTVVLLGAGDRHVRYHQASRSG